MAVLWVGYSYSSGEFPVENSYALPFASLLKTVTVPDLVIISSPSDQQIKSIETQFPKTPLLIEGISGDCSRNLFYNPTSCPQFTKYWINSQLRLKEMKQELVHKKDDYIKALNQVSTLTLNMEKLATEDPLTGIPNRRTFFTQIDREWSRAIRMNSGISIAMMDIDFFKKVNDTYGHRKGDEVLIAFAKALMQETRRTDIVARYGGEEFVSFMHTPELNTAEQFSQRIHDRTSKLPETAEYTELPPITLTIGLIFIQPQYVRDSSPEKALSLADQALYRGKAEGRNRTIFNSIGV